MQRATQYSLRLYIYLYSRPKNAPIRITQASQRSSRKSGYLLLVVACLSLTRRLNNFVHTLTSLSTLPSTLPSSMSLSSLSLHQPTAASLTDLAEQLLAVINSIADDCFFLSLAFPSSSRFARFREPADKYADLSWLLLSLLGFRRVQRERAAIWSKGRQVRQHMIDLSASVGGEEGRTEEQSTEARRCRAILRELRRSLNELYWERLRLGSDAVFAGTPAFSLSLIARY